MLRNKTLTILVESALMIALATILSEIPLIELVTGGSVTVLSMLPILYISFRFGILPGLSAGFVYSLIQLLFGLKNLAYIPSATGVVLSILLDYIIPFTLLGLAAIFVRKGEKIKLLPILAGILFVCAIRMLCHTVVGAVVWYDLALEQQWYDYVSETNALGYSLIYNGSYMGIETAVTLFGAAILQSVLRIFPSRTQRIK